MKLKIRTTLENKLEYSELALKKWRELDPKSVYPSLARWRSTCGTQSCFGGHLATWPEFQALGILPDIKASFPCMLKKDGRLRYPQKIASLLFGNPRIFQIKDSSEYSLSDHEAIVQRLEHCISDLKARIKRRGVRK